MDKKRFRLRLRSRLESLLNLSLDLNLLWALAFLMTLVLGCDKGSAPEGMVLIPAGEFTMGSNKTDTEGKGNEFGSVKPWYLDEHPERRIKLKAYYVDKFEVTNVEYKKFVDATNSRPPEHWRDGNPPDGKGTFPVTYANWYEADRYCRWAGKRLPTESEWEKAARGPNGMEYPWGDQFDGKKANTGDSGFGDIAPVGSFPDGMSVYGVYDMSGNAWEWVDDWYKPYPGSDYKSDKFGEKNKVLRGGSWGGGVHYSIPLFYRGAYRFYTTPERGFPDAGFRCVKDR